MNFANLRLPYQDFIQKNPAALPVLDRLGLKPVPPQTALPVNLLLQVRGLDPQLFLKSLAAAGPGAEEGPVFPESWSDDRRALEFLGYVPCSIREDFRQGVWNRLRHGGLDQDRFPWFVPGGCGAQDLYEGLWQEPELSKLPSLIVSLGFGDFFRPGFVNQRLETGEYTAVPGAEYAPEFTEAGIPDPRGQYSLYAVQTYVILADLTRLAGRDLPRRWADLGNPVWKGDLVIGGDGDEVSEVLLHYIYQDGGTAAVEALARNVKDGWHAAQMAKLAGSGSPQGAALYVLPWFFAESCPHREKAVVHWPEDGGLASPLYAILKRDADPQVQDLARYLMGPELGQAFRRNHYPAAADPGLSPGQKLRWLGWDYIRRQSMPDLGKELQSRFQAVRSKADRLQAGRFPSLRSER